MALSERRAQLYLTKEQYQKVMRLAKQKHTSFAQVVREAIEEFLRKNHSRWEQDPITKHIGVFEGKETDLSINHDRYIYGDQDVE